MKCWQKLYFTTQLEIEFPFIYVVLNSYTTSNNKWQRIESIGHHNNYLKWMQNLLSENMSTFDATTCINQ